MKRVILILIFAGFLTACGGGGGGNTPSVQMPEDPMQTDNGENDNPQMDDMQTDNGGNDSPVKSEYDDDEFNANYSLRQMGALYAYENGYFGQSVTIGISEEIRETHEDLAANAISLTTTIAGIRKPVSQNMDGHGTGVIGIAVAARNDKGGHGVAPQAKFVSFDSRSQINSEARRQFLIESGIQIFNHSFGTNPSQDLTVYANRLATVYGGLDVIFSTGAENNARNGIIDPIASGGNGMLPILQTVLAPQWIVAVGLNRDNSINITSNACGVATLWCISAYGNEIHTTGHESDSDYVEDFGGTSAAAPQVSGALALLKSFRPELKMTVIRQVLLESARPLGTRKNDGMPDEVFGWGAVDVGNGIATLQAMQTANGMAYSDLRKSLPGEFSHLRGRMESVSVALRITDRSYYNMRLSDIVGGGDSQKTSLGNAAKEMQADDSLSPENSGFGFNYANGDYDLHYAGGGGENAFRFSGGLRHDDSQSSYIGEGSSPFSAENASDTGGYVKWTTKNYGGISAFGEYGRTQIKADYDSNSFVSKIQNARAEEWTAGFQYRDLFLHNDNLQFSARQESRISGGEMILHYPVADGDSHKAFIGESPQTIRTETAKIPIKQKPQTIYTAGYSQKTENSKWSAAAEWNAATNAKGVSFAIEFALH